MSELRVIAMDAALAAQVRMTMQSPGYGHPATVSVAKGHGPCRLCLEPFVVGEERRILFTMNSFAGVSGKAGQAAIPQPGPVFVHDRECTRYAENGGYPARLLRFGAVLDGYDAAQRVVLRETVFDGTQEAGIARIFSDERVRYVMVRDANAGCYDFLVERRN